MAATHHRSLSRLLTATASSQELLALLVLNVETAIANTFRSLWEKSNIRVCADGAANRLYDRFGASDEFIPDAVLGDLDSVRDEVKQYYTSKGVNVETDADQDSHDMEKCLRYLQTQQEKKQKRMHVVVVGAFGGRFDQEMANINMTFHYAGAFATLILISESSLGFLLNPGKHVIEIDPELEERKGCGLIPLGSSAQSVTTSGFRWNLTNYPFEFGGMVSTSNEILDTVVEVETSHPLFWTTTMKKQKIPQRHGVSSL